LVFINIIIMLKISSYTNFNLDTENVLAFTFLREWNYRSFIGVKAKLYHADHRSFLHPLKARFPLIPTLLKNLLLSILLIKDLFNTISDTRTTRVRSHFYERYVALLRDDQ